ncbi:unnamed protein product [Blepharisma stoltei]|uniref:C2H2-type domain-containing protein n=1 Tax=Blepharisma stoltei TaxID=1481888 RepID=A0AAU9JBD1_9CILI|nr:unnamed protein product [Blepharisma stoltei]
MKDIIYECKAPGCSSTYASETNLKRHIEAYHTESKKFQCNFCMKILSSKQNLKEHTFTHSGEKPYVCKEPGCGMKFRQGSQLSSHKRVHVAIKAYTHKAETNKVKETYIKLTEWIDKSNFYKLEQVLPVLQTSEEYSFMLPPISEPQGFCTLPAAIFGSQLFNQ